MNPRIIALPLILAASMIATCKKNSSTSDSIPLYSNPIVSIPNGLAAYPDLPQPIMDLCESNNQLFALSQAGVSVSQDGGATWRTAFGVRPGGIACSTSSVYVTTPSAVWITRDGALSWSKLLHGDEAFAEQLVMVADGVLYRFRYRGVDGILYSEDFGNTWQRGPDGSFLDMTNAGGKAYFLASEGLYVRENKPGAPFIKTFDSDPDFAGNLLYKGGHALYMVGVNEVFASTDDGKTWTLFASGTSKFCAKGARIMRIQEGVFGISLDGGTTWQNSSTSSNNVTDLICGDNVLALISKEKSALILSRDNGQSWQEIPLGTREPPMRGRVSEFLAVDKDIYFSDVYYAGNGGQTISWIHHSHDEGRTWSTVPQGFSASFRRIVVSQDKIFGAAFGLYESSDKATSWQPIPGTFNYGFFTDLEPINSTLLAATAEYGEYDSHIIRSTDGGRTWKETLVISYVSQLVGSRSGNVFGLSSAGLIISRDEGLTWLTIRPNNVLDWNDPDNITGIVVNEDRIYAIRSAGTLISDDQGQTWKLFSLPDPNLRIIGLQAVGPLIVVRDNVDNLHISNDSGLHWTTREVPRSAFFIHGGTIYFYGDELYSVNAIFPNE